MKCGLARTAQVAGQQTFLQAQRLASLFRTRVPRKALTFGRSLETSSAELATYAYRLTIRWKTRRLHRTGPDSLVVLEQEWNAKAEEMHSRDRPHQQSASPSAKAAPKVLFPFDTRSRKIKSNSATTTTTPKNPKGEESRFGETCSKGTFPLCTASQFHFYSANSEERHVLTFHE